jgi:hypothetical protein
MEAGFLDPPGVPSGTGGIFAIGGMSHCIYQQDHLFAVCYLSVYVSGPDHLRIIPSPYSGKAQVADCSAKEYQLGGRTPSRLGIAGFGMPGYNPISGITAVPEGGFSMSLSLRVSGDNPARGASALTYVLPEAGPVRLDIVDIAGRRVRTLVEAFEAAGARRVVWDGRDKTGWTAPAGIYFARLEWNGASRSQRFLRIR